LALVEREPLLAQVASANIALNALQDRAKIFECDALSSRARVAAGLAANSADIVITNPPYLDAATSRTSPDHLRAGAHSFEAADGLDRWLRACAALLRPSGVFAMIHRADALEKVLAASAGRFGALEIRPVHSRAGAPAIRILVRARKGSRAPVQILPGLVIHGADGAFTSQAAAIHAGERLID
jgi:tRNA1(Val) A37 N6-methylase TrmN6